MQYFSKKKKKSIQILKMKILWYFIVFLDFFFNIIKLGEPKFTISYSKSILIFSILEVHVLPMLVYIKSGNATTVIWYCVHSMCLHCASTVAVTVFWWGTLPFSFFIFSFEQYSSYPFFFVFHLYFFFPFIYIVLLHNKFHNIFTIIKVSISYKLK